jgi:predicted DNA-binding transcriptional regulator AlpA
MTASLNLPEAQDFPREDIAPAIAQLAGLQTALAARLIVEKPTPEKAEEIDDLITAEEACSILRMKKTWLYGHAKSLPFVRRISARSVRFSKRGIFAWLAKRR